MKWVETACRGALCSKFGNALSRLGTASAPLLGFRAPMGCDRSSGGLSHRRVHSVETSR